MIFFYSIYQFIHIFFVFLLYIVVDETYKYGLVLEYADEDTLDSYLNKHFDKLNLYDKYKLAFQLASGVSYMHECNIIHRSLVIYNYLIRLFI
jgi:serine/threonine protein kinase